jgi:hypothetical protein
MFLQGLIGRAVDGDRAAQAELETTRPLSPDLTMLWNPASLFVTMTCPPPVFHEHSGVGYPANCFLAILEHYGNEAASLFNVFRL